MFKNFKIISKLSLVGRLFNKTQGNCLQPITLLNSVAGIFLVFFFEKAAPKTLENIFKNVCSWLKTPLQILFRKCFERKGCSKNSWVPTIQRATKIYLLNVLWIMTIKEVSKFQYFTVAKQRFRTKQVQRIYFENGFGKVKVLWN